MNNKNLFDLLRANKAQDISLLTDEKTFQRGREYFLRRRIESFSWDKEDSGRLIVIVQGSKAYRVTIKNIQGVIYYLCTCPAWAMDLVCKHIICVLLAAREELPEPDNKAEASEYLRLSANMKNNQLITIHLFPSLETWHPSAPHFKIVFMRGIEKLGPHNFSRLSLEAALCMPSMLAVSIEDQLAQLLNYRKAPMYGITIHTEDGPLDVFWDKADWAFPVVELDVVDEAIHARRLALDQHKVLIDSILKIGEQFIVDVNAKRLLLIDQSFVWEWFDYVLLYKKNDDKDEHSAYLQKQQTKFRLISEPILIEAFEFNNCFTIKYPQAEFKAFESMFLIKVSGMKAPIAKQGLQFVIDGDVDSALGVVKFEVLAMLEGLAIPIFQNFIEHVRKIDLELSSWLRTKKRRLMIIKTLFALIASSYSLNKMNDIMMKAILELRNSVDGAKRYGDLKRYFNDFCQLLKAPIEESIVMVGGSFKRVILDPLQQWQVLSILSSRFDSTCFNEYGVAPSFTVSLDLFYAQLSSLKNFLDEQNIELRLNNKPLKMMVLDVSIDASHSLHRGGDWLEIAPHIMADGIVLTDKQREVLYSNDGSLIETADCIKILDPQSQEIIKMLARMFIQQRDGSKINEKNGIVQLPRLRVLDLLELRQKGASVKLSPDDELLISRLSQFEKIDKIALPKSFTGTLREYQKIGYRWLAFLYKNRFGACLADDMGLGKTVQAIAFLGGIFEKIIKSRSDKALPHLIVVPPTLVFNWQNELSIFYSALRVGAYIGAGRNRDFSRYDVVITTYDCVRLDVDLLKELNFHVLILDEAQAIKNIEAARTAAVRQLKSIFTISLTGTPLENHLGEYHSIIDVALPGLLPDYRAFMRCVQEGSHDSFVKRTRPFVLRRTKEAILKDLPEKMESNVFLDMAEKQQKMYATTVAEVKRLIEQAYETKTSGQATIIALTAILRLRQICISPQMIDKSKDAESPKIDYLVSSLESILKEGSAALVFSQFTTCLDLIEEALCNIGLPYVRIDGKTTMAMRRKIIESFQKHEGDVSILLLSLKTGGVGLNLTRANYVFHVDPWWNPAVENQASDRSHRIGQKNKVFVTRLVMHHTIEEKMMTLKEAKKKLFSEIMDLAESKAKGIITKQDLDLLLS
ncbi:hypothetical protein FJ364_01450 [Candidatus Dependentiae bacterium]|nr:hypothetical protein [Candidatus Dependentiae bacterium]